MLSKFISEPSYWWYPQREAKGIGRERRKQQGGVTTGDFRENWTKLFLEGSRGSYLGEEFLPGTSQEKYLSWEADRGTVGWAVEGSVIVLLQHWEGGSALLWCAWWTCLAVGMDFSCPGFGNEVKIRQNPRKKWQASGEVFCCLILWEQSGNCTPSSCCEIAATDNQNWDRYFYLDFRVPIYSFSPNACL